MTVEKEFNQVTNYFSPLIIDELNDHYIKLAKIKGQEVPWHNHENEDELFYIVKGKLIMEVEKQPGLIMNSGDLYVVRKGINHRVSSEEECLIMLIEPKTTDHTGKVKSGITKSINEQR